MTETNATSNSGSLHREVSRIAQQIKAIRGVVQTAGAFHFDVAKLKARTKLTFSEDGSSRTTAKGSTIDVERDFLLRGVDDSNSEVAVHVAATFSVCYDLAEPQEVPDDVLQTLGDLNSRFNLTAYWREFVQSCCARAGLPPFPITPFNAYHAVKKLKPPALPES